MKGLLRFVCKVGALSYAVYYSKQVGVWKDSSRTYDLSREFVLFCQPYLEPVTKRVQDELPFKVEQLPTSDDICRSVSSSWNTGVIWSISFTRNVPALLGTYINQGTAFIQNELKKN